MARILTEAEKAKKRKKLIKLATAILERDGELGLTARSLAKEANISRTTPYLYFKDKEAILNGIRLETLNHLSAKFKSAAPAEPLQQMRMFGEIYTVFGLDHPELYRLVFMSDFSLKPMTDDVSHALAGFQTLILTPMEKAYKDGLVRLPADRLNLVMWSSIHGLLTLSHSGLMDKQSILPQLRQDIGLILSQGFLTGDKGK